MALEKFPNVTPDGPVAKPYRARSKRPKKMTTSRVPKPASTTGGAMAPSSLSDNLNGFRDQMKTQMLASKRGSAAKPPAAAQALKKNAANLARQYMARAR